MRKESTPIPSGDTRDPFLLHPVWKRRILPFACGCGMAASLLWSAYLRRGRGIWLPAGLSLAGLLVLGYHFLISRFFSWSGMIREDDKVVLMAGRLPFGLATRFFIKAFPPIRDGSLRIPLDSIRMEWLGNQLLLHGHPRGDVCLARGRNARRAAEWLRA